jgi:hypothetical protein
VILAYKDCCLKGPEAVYASAIFHNHVTDKRIANLRRYYGDSLMLGGSGVDINRFSPNNNKGIKQLARKYKMLRFTAQDNVEFICMYGFNTTLAEDVARFRFLRSLPGAYVFVQQYQPILGGPPTASIPFFDEHADDLIDELIGIVFPQNMKRNARFLILPYENKCKTIVGPLNINPENSVRTNQKTGNKQYGCQSGPFYWRRSGGVRFDQCPNMRKGNRFANIR